MSISSHSPPPPPPPISSLSVPKAITLMRDLSQMLCLSHEAYGTALTYFHQYHSFMEKESIREYPHPSPFLLDDEVLAMACVQLACKKTDAQRKIRDVINVAHFLLCPDQEPIDLGQHYWTLRDSISTAELILQRALHFHHNFELPFGWALRVVKGLAAIGLLQERKAGKLSLTNGHNQTESEEVKDIHPRCAAIAHLTWTFISDSLCLREVSLSFNHKVIALSCVYLALRAVEIDLPPPGNFNEWCAEWSEGEANPESVKSCTEIIIDMYKASQSPR
ncbi:uncharacterized protein VTP21DRAFT_5124 [Calcarisporiella thermophila]|uniref:uncharacterized protein n=1 Tax=Calcarisporiella thermophila TaxID=911321 RepID=UPI0037427333